MKKVFTSFLSAVLLFQAVPSLPAIGTVNAAEQKSYLYGDMDGDEVLSIFDIVLLRQATIDNSKLNDITKVTSDLDADDKLDGEDLQLLQDYILGKNVTFPAGVWYTPVTEQPYNGQKKLTGSRMYEYLDRGTYAVSAGNAVFVSWRLLASDESDIGFNVYRTTNGVTEKLNDEVLTGGTNYTDNTADMTQDNTYYVTTVYNGVETPTDGEFTLKAGASIAGDKNNAGAAQIIPIKEGGTIHFVWVGDFNGDGAYDFLVDRSADDHQKLEAYLNDGTYLWTLDLGVNSENKNNISPGASTIDVGMWDGATVYDIDCDGTAEVMVRIANGVTFGDGEKYSSSSGADGQAIAVINGMTGALESSVNLPSDYLSVGAMACMMEVGYLDGVHPSLVCWLKNRNANKSFNSLMVAYGFGGADNFKQEWKFDAGKQGGGAEAHQFRVEDVDYDGKD